MPFFSLNTKKTDEFIQTPCYAPWTNGPCQLLVAQLCGWCAIAIPWTPGKHWHQSLATHREAWHRKARLGVSAYTPFLNALLPWQSLSRFEILLLLKLGSQNETVKEVLFCSIGSKLLKKTKQTNKNILTSWRIMCAIMLHPSKIKCMPVCDVSDLFLDGMSGWNKVALWCIFSLINKIFMKYMTFNSARTLFPISLVVCKHFLNNT